MQRLANLLVNSIDRLSDWLGIILSWMCFAMMLLTCVVVAMRYIFHFGNIIFLQESVIYLHSTIFLLAAGWTLKRNGHVRVDVFYRQYSPIRKAWVDSLGVLIFLLPICGLMFFASMGFIQLSWSIKETSGDAGGIPLVYILKTLIPAMCIVLALQGVAELVRNTLFLCGLVPEPDNTPPPHGSNEL